MLAHFNSAQCHAHTHGVATRTLGGPGVDLRGCEAPAPPRYLATPCDVIRNQYTYMRVAPPPTLCWGLYSVCKGIRVSVDRAWSGDDRGLPAANGGLRLCTERVNMQGVTVCFETGGFWWRVQQDNALLAEIGVFKDSPIFI